MNVAPPRAAHAVGPRFALVRSGTPAGLDTSKREKDEHMSTNLANRFTRFLVAALGAAALLFGTVPAVEAQSRSGTVAPAESTGPTVDIQTASAAELETLPGVGPARAQAIIEYRTRTPFRRAEDLMRVDGIGRATFRNLRGRISVGGVRAEPEAGE